jgi:chromate transporter
MVTGLPPGGVAAASESPVRVPREPLGRLFLRFLRFGALAWGGPVAQIAMIRQELVEEERWVTREQFNRALAVYQVLPGPEAHELCVYFGMLSRGRVGGALAGLGFMLPGFLLMFALSWAYVRFGLTAAGVTAVFAAMQAAVAALIVRAVHRIGSHVVTDRWLLGIAIAAAAAHLGGVHFAVILAAAGLLYAAARQARSGLALTLATVLAGGAIAFLLLTGVEPARLESAPGTAMSDAAGQVSLPGLLWSGLRAGLLTFGGAYTVIPFLQEDAVSTGAWMTNAQFLDGLALSGLLPAPLIIFSTFVGYVGGGPGGALLMTVGIFLPAFAFTLLGHDALERFVHQPRIRVFLDGVTAGVVGLIAGTTLVLLRTSVTSLETAIVFALALAALFLWKGRLLVPLVICAAGAWGLVSTLVGH